MRLLTTLTALLLTVFVLNLAQGQEAKAPAKQDDKKEAGKNEKPADPQKGDDKKDDKGKDDKKPDDKKGDKGKDDKKPDDKKPDDKKNPKDTTPKFAYHYTFAGKLMSVSPNSGELTIQVSYKVKTAHADANQRYINWQKDLANRQVQIAQEKNPQTRFNQMIEYQKVLAKPPELFYFKDVTQDVILKQAKDMKVRGQFPEIQYDTKGNPIPLTKEKVKELQGPEGYPGFPLDNPTLPTNTTVQVYLVFPTPKGVVDPKDPKKKAPDITDIIGATKPKDKDKKEPGVEDDDTTSPRIVAVMIANNYKQ